MAGAGFDLIGLRRERALRARRHARFGRAHALRADQCRALLQIGVVEQARPAAGRRRYEVGVAEVHGAVGIGQARRLGVGVQPIGARQIFNQGHGHRRAALHHAEDLHHRDVSRRGRREAADAQGRFPIGADRLALLRRIAREIGFAQQPGIGGVTAHAPDHIGGDGAAVQRSAAARSDGAQDLGERRVAHHGADGMRLSVGGVEVGQGLGVTLQRGLALEQRVEPRAHAKALFGQRDRGLEQRRPRQLTVFAVRSFEHAHGARHADRAATGHGMAKGHRLAVRQQEELFVGRRGRGLTAVPCRHVPAVPVQQEGAASDAAGLRLDEREHHLHRDRRIERAAASLERLVAGVGGQRIGRSHHEAQRRPARLFGEARGAFGQLRDGVVKTRGGLRRARDTQHGDDGGQWNSSHRSPPCRKPYTLRLRPARLVGHDRLRQVLHLVAGHQTD